MVFTPLFTPNYTRVTPNSHSETCEFADVSKKSHLLINAHYCTDVLEPDDLTVIGFLFCGIEMIEYTQIGICRGGWEDMILLVVDMQRGLVDEDLYAFDTFIDRTVRLVDAARKNSVEVIFVQHDAGPGSGMSVGDEDFEIVDQIAPKEEEKVFVKTINSCFGNIEFKEYMEHQDDKRLMVIGLQTNYCIDCTVKSAFERGFAVIIPEGTNSTFDNDYMTGETAVRYYNEDVWEELVDAVTFEEAMTMLEE